MARIDPHTKDLVRSNLITTAADHFARYGFADANINAIALDAGYAKGTVYNYFPSKEALFAAVLQEACQRVAARYASLPHGQSTRASLIALAQNDVAVLKEEEGFMQVLVREAMSFRPQTYPLIIENLAPIMDLIQDIIARGQGNGEVHTARSPQQLALLFVGLLSLLYVQHWGSGGTWPALDEIPTLAVELFLDGAGQGRLASGRGI